LDTQSGELFGEECSLDRGKLDSVELETLLVSVFAERFGLKSSRCSAILVSKRLGFSETRLKTSNSLSSLLIVQQNPNSSSSSDPTHGHHPLQNHFFCSNSLCIHRVSASIQPMNPSRRLRNEESLPRSQLCQHTKVFSFVSRSVARPRVHTLRFGDDT
jgi:hypothetical protein